MKEKIEQLEKRIEELETENLGRKDENTGLRKMVEALEDREIERGDYEECEEDEECEHEWEEFNRFYFYDRDYVAERCTKCGWSRGVDREKESQEIMKSTMERTDKDMFEEYTDKAQKRLKEKLCGTDNEEPDVPVLD